MADIFVLVNPVSANGTTAGVWPQIAAAFKEVGLEFDYYLTTRPFEAPEVVRQALRGGAKTVVAVGGDGTIHEVVNGFFEDETPINPEARLALISRGTGCDLIRTLGTPKPWDQAIKVIARGRDMVMDLGLCKYIDHQGQPSSRWFVNIADVGLGGAVATRVNHTSKSAGGFLSYLYGTVWSILRYQNGHGRVEVDSQEVYQGPITMAAVSNGRYFGGGMHLSPNSKLNDGKLDLVLLEGVSKISILLHLLRIYRGTHLKHPSIRVIPAQDIKVTTQAPMPLELDGEVPGVTPVSFHVRPKAIKIIY
jgi:YegS/Rv2252/BmrU family lipid kinase